MAERRRFPASVFSRGQEPDPRFTLANERTFLAWVGTSLALISVGVGLESLGLALHPGLRLAASIVFVVAGLICPIQAWVGWARVERAMREHLPLPPSPVAPIVTVAVVLAGLLVLVGFVLRP